MHKSYPVESRFDNTDAFVISGSEDGALHFYDLVEGKTVATYVFLCVCRVCLLRGVLTHNGGGSGACLTFDTYTRGTLKFKKKIKKKKKNRAKEHTRALCSLAYHPTEPALLTAGYDGLGLVWSARGDD